MGKFFNTNNAYQTMSPRMRFEQTLNMARAYLILTLVCSVVNIVLLLTQSNMYFLFSASIPYFLIGFTMFFCGLYPENAYVGLSFETFDISLFVLAIIVSVAILAVYLLCWIFSKKRGIAWLICALAMFSLDTVAMFVLWNFGSNPLIDILIHGLVIFFLASGVRAQIKLKNMPEEPAAAQAEAAEAAENGEEALAKEESDEDKTEPEGEAPAEETAKTEQNGNEE